MPQQKASHSPLASVAGQKKHEPKNNAEKKHLVRWWWWWLLLLLLSGFYFIFPCSAHRPSGEKSRVRWNITKNDSMKLDRKPLIKSRNEQTFSECGESEWKMLAALSADAGPIRTNSLTLQPSPGHVCARVLTMEIFAVDPERERRIPFHLPNARRDLYDSVSSLCIEIVVLANKRQTFSAAEEQRLNQTPVL